MASSNESDDDHKTAVKVDWGKDNFARHYLDHVTRFTVYFAKDMISMMHKELSEAKTILDIGCGPGTFGLAYLEAFPTGVPGQTLILSDLSPEMVQVAEQEMKERIPDNFQTTLKYQVEDGGLLEGIQDGSIDVVVSIFGVFLIPDYLKTLKTIIRVLRKDNPNAAFGTAVWTLTQQRHALAQEGFGPSFHEIIEEELNKLTNLSDADWKRWFEPAQVQQMVVQEAGFSASSFQIYRSLHSVAWPNAQAVWDIIATNPMAKIKDADPQDVKAAKQNLFATMDRAADGDDRPVLLSTASNLIIAKP